MMLLPVQTVPEFRLQLAWQLTEVIRPLGLASRGASWPWPGLPLVLPDLRKPGNVDPASLVWAMKAFEVEDGQEFGRVQLFLDRPRLEKYPAKAKSELRADIATSAACAGPPVAKGRGEGETTEPAQPASLPTANNYSLASFWQALLQEAASARRQKHSIGVAAA